MDGATETIVASAYCVVYHLEGSKWVVTGGEGWTQILLLKDTVDETYRVVGWTLSDSQVVLNCNIVSTCVYKKKSDDFHKFTDEDGIVFGFGFYQKVESIKEAKEFMGAVIDIISKMAAKAKEEEKAKASAGTLDLNDLKSNLPGSDYIVKGHLPLGSLTVLQPRSIAREADKGDKGDKSISEAPTDSGVSLPSNVKHLGHIAYDAKTRSYTGLPLDWQASLSKQFGLDPKQVDRDFIPGYTAKIPTCLQEMKEYLVSHEGLETVGIFRIAPDAAESNYIKQLLNENKFTECEDVHCISNLIKVWFRDLPISLLQNVQEAKIEACDSAEEAGAIIMTDLKEPSQSIFLWLLDLGNLIADNAHINKMTRKNLAIVFGPNMFTPSHNDPMVSLIFSQKVANFLDFSLHWRAKNVEK